MYFHFYHLEKCIYFLFYFHSSFGKIYFNNLFSFISFLWYFIFFYFYYLAKYFLIIYFHLYHLAKCIYFFINFHFYHLAKFNFFKIYFYFYHLCKIFFLYNLFSFLSFGKNWVVFGSICGHVWPTTANQPSCCSSRTRSQSCKMYLFKLPNIFVKIFKYISPNCQIYLYTCSNFKLYLSKPNNQPSCCSRKLFLGNFPWIF